MVDEVGEAGASHADAVRDFRRVRVLEAARTVFSEEGLDGASVRAIASAAGCTTGAIYSQFRGKEDLYAGVLSTSLAGLHAAVAPAAGAVDDPADRLGAAIDAYVGYYRERPSEVALGLYLFRGIRPVGLGTELDAALNAQLRRVLDVFQDAVSALSPQADAELETASLFTHLMGLLIVDQTRRIRVTQRATDELLDHLRGSLVVRLTGGG